MKKLTFLLCAATCATMVSCSHKALTEASYQVIPLPHEIIAGNGEGFTLTDATVIACPEGDSALMSNARLLAEYLEPLTGSRLQITTDAGATGAITLTDTLTSDNHEAYRLTVSPAGIQIDGASPAGNFYGIQTLRKSIPHGGNQDVHFPEVTINDAPRFGYRGAHFDVARHFFPIDSVKKFIDMAALHNINTFHWHLTDDQGWRLEIKKYPRLAEIASMRKGTCIGKDFDSSDSIPYGGFYTQEEARDLVRYAAERHITVIPEVDLPGHMVAAMTAYPHLGCTGGPYEVWQRWGISDDVLCAGNDSVYTFITDVLDELTDIFPSEYIHVGGDECPKVRWENCPKCQAKIKQLGLKTDSHSTAEQKLQSHVMEKASEFLATKGRKMIGWDEIMEGGLTPGTVIMSWRGPSGGLKAAQMGHDAVMTPNNFFYFDYYQSLDHENEPLAIGGYVPLEKAYSFQPVPDTFTPEEAAHIKGVQANLWTEYIATFPHAQYMELPRMAALSEVQWCDESQKDFNDFCRRLPQLIAHYDLLGYNYARHIFDINASKTPDAEANAVRLTLTTCDGAPVRYTLDGSDPDDTDSLYTGELLIDRPARIKAVAIRPDGHSSRVFTDTVNVNKATFKPITLVNDPHPRYSGNGAATLNDGILGAEAFADGCWLGFLTEPMAATIDLGENTDIASIKVRYLVSTPDWIFEPSNITVEVSDDGKTFNIAGKENNKMLTKDETGIHTFSTPAKSARYVRVTATPQNEIPSWHVGHGQKPFIFVDEIIIE